ncbi:MAG TPA: serine/threonine-protein kinase, partial [Polyangiaceae bacterium]|nr:serine/threonine-protein kinase [Polyangiaceae bacterium]
MDDYMDVRPGEVLAGKYRIEQVLGQGGMGVIVQATHLQLDERVAIKFLLPQALENEEAVMRFAREARAAVKIKSEHVARVTDVGTLGTGCPYMVMEYLSGSDLSQLIQDRGPLPIEEAVDYILQASEALAEAHALGIVHRDLKPANLFHTRRADGSSCIKVLDFGISKVTGLSGSGADLGMTRTTAVMGSPLYMSPEQMASSRNVDARTDIWSLGIILYELLAGRAPFLADTMPQLCAMILQQSAPPLRNVRPDAPEALQSVLARCLEKEPARRYANIAELAAALLPFASRLGKNSVERISRVMSAAGISSREVNVPAQALRTVSDGTQSGWGNTAQTKKGRGPWLLLGAALLALGGAAAALLVTRSLNAPEKTPTSAAEPAAPTAPAPTAEGTAPSLAKSPEAPAVAIAVPAAS